MPLTLSSNLLYAYHRAEAVRSARLGRACYGGIIKVMWIRIRCAGTVLCVLLHARQKFAVPVPLALAGPWLILALVKEVAELAIYSILTANLRVHEEAWLAIAQLVLRGTC